MSAVRNDSTVSRRAAVAGLGAGGLGLALAARGAAAQDATVDMATHPIVGTWAAEFDASFVYNTFLPDGTFLSLHPFAGTGFGRWQATGERTYDAVCKYLNIANEAGKVDPGTVTVWSSTTVDESDHHTSEGVVELRGPDGTVVALFPISSDGGVTRLTVEPPPPLPAPEATPSA